MFAMDHRCIVDMATLQEKVYFLTLHSNAHEFQLEHVLTTSAEPRPEFAIDKVATLAGGSVKTPLAQAKLTLARTVALGDIALISWMGSQLHVVRLQSGVVTVVTGATCSAPARNHPVR